MSRVPTTADVIADAVRHGDGRDWAFAMGMIRVAVFDPGYPDDTARITEIRGIFGAFDEAREQVRRGVRTALADARRTVAR